MSRFLLAAALAALLIPAASAQPAGFDVAQLDAFFSRPPKVEVNLRGALLRLAASATDDDPETASMLRGLRSILVRVYSMDSARDGLTGRLDAIEQQMQGSGWETLVRVRPDGVDETDDVWVYVREAGDAFDGMAVVSLDHDEGDASFVLIDGLIDPSRIGALGGRFGVNIGGAEDASDDAEGAMDAADDARDAAQEAADEAADAAREARDGQREAARELREQARDDAREARDRGREARDRERIAPRPAAPTPPTPPAAPARPVRPSRPS